MVRGPREVHEYTGVCTETHVQKVKKKLTLKQTVLSRDLIAFFYLLEVRRRKRSENS